MSIIYSKDNVGRPTTSVQPDAYTQKTIEELKARGHTDIRIKTENKK